MSTHPTHALTDNEFGEMLDLQRKLNGGYGNGDDARRLGTFIDRLTVDRHALGEQETEEYIFLTGLLASAVACNNAEAARRLCELNDLYQAENPFPGEVVSGADVLAAARNVVRDGDRG